MWLPAVLLYSLILFHPFTIGTLFVIWLICGNAGSNKRR